MTTWLSKLTKPSPTNEAPTRSEILRNDALVALVVLFALFLGFGMRNQVLSAHKTVELGKDLPKLAYPARWTPRQTDPPLIFHAINPGSPSTFDAQISVTARALRADESLDKARADRAFKLAAALPGYRELAVEEMLVYRDLPALVSTYAFLADPTRDSGAYGLPVVVEAQDIMYLDNNQFVTVAVAADANEWDHEQADFQIIFDSMKLQPKPTSTPTPADSGNGQPSEGGN